MADWTNAKRGVEELLKNELAFRALRAVAAANPEIEENAIVQHAMDRIGYAQEGVRHIDPALLPTNEQYQSFAQENLERFERLTGVLAREPGELSVFTTRSFRDIVLKGPQNEAETVLLNNARLHLDGNQLMDAVAKDLTPLEVVGKIQEVVAAKEAIALSQAVEIEKDLQEEKKSAEEQNPEKDVSLADVTEIIGVAVAAAESISNNLIVPEQKSESVAQSNNERNTSLSEAIEKVAAVVNNIVVGGVESADMNDIRTPNTPNNSDRSRGGGISRE